MNIFSQVQTKSHSGIILFLFFLLETILYKQIRAEVSKQTDFPRAPQCERYTFETKQEGDAHNMRTYWKDTEVKN